MAEVSRHNGFGFLAPHVYCFRLHWIRKEKILAAQLRTFHNAIMRKGFRIGLPVLVIGLLCWQVWRALDDQPSYHGKSLHAWLQQQAAAAYAHDKQGRQEAEAAIRLIGTNALPTLLVWISTRDSTLEKTLRAHIKLNDVTWEKVPFLGGGSRSRWRAAQACGLLGPIAKPMIPSLVSLLKDTDWRIRASAMCALAQMGPAAEEAVPALLQNLEDPLLDHAAICTLPVIGARPEAIMPSFIGILSSTNFHRQMCVMYILGQYGTNAQAAAPSLMKFLNHPDRSLRDEATKALLLIDPHNLPVPSLVNMLDYPERKIREAATNTLRQMGPTVAAEAGVK
jgi:HEAT repeat protein